MRRLSHHAVEESQTKPYELAMRWLSHHAVGERQTKRRKLVMRWFLSSCRGKMQTKLPDLDLFVANVRGRVAEPKPLALFCALKSDPHPKTSRHKALASRASLPARSIARSIAPVTVLGILRGEWATPQRLKRKAWSLPHRGWACFAESRSCSALGCC